MKKMILAAVGTFAWRWLRRRVGGSRRMQAGRR